MSFSERMGLTPERQIQTESMDDKLRNRLYNFFEEIIQSEDKEKVFKYIIDKMGELEDVEYIQVIKNKFFDKSLWYNPYEIIEYAFEYLFDKGFVDYFNITNKKIKKILIEEKSGYRFFEGKFVPITDETALEEIKTAMHSEFEAVDTHISKALSLYSDRNKPDYENSIKESISAVESMCSIITGMTEKNATLSKTIKKLENHGIHIHGAMAAAFDSLYGYASGECGIRHGGIDFKKAPEEDARYMLVSCSAFVNYLKAKYSKSKSAE